MSSIYNHILSFRQGIHKEWYWSVYYGGQEFGPFHTRAEAKRHALKALKKAGFTGEPNYEDLAGEAPLMLECLIIAMCDDGGWHAPAEAIVYRAFGLQTIIDRLNRESHYLQVDVIRRYREKAERAAAVAHGLDPAK